MEVVPEDWNNAYSTLRSHLIRAQRILRSCLTSSFRRSPRRPKTGKSRMDL